MGISYLLFIPLFLAAVAVIIAVAMRKPRHTYRGENDARNFDSGGPTFYPGDAVESPSSTPPPRQFESDAATPETGAHHHHHTSSDAHVPADGLLENPDAGSSAPASDSGPSYESGSSASDSGSSSSFDSLSSSSDSGSSGGSCDSGGGGSSSSD